MTKAERTALFDEMQKLFVALSKTRDKIEQQQLEEAIRSLAYKIDREDHNGPT